MGILIPTILLALLIPGMTIMASNGKLPPNGIMGIRTRTTQSSPEAWQAAHHAAGKLLIPVSALVLLGCLLVLTGITEKLGTAEVLSSVLLGVLVLAIIVSGVIAQKVAKRVAAEQFSKTFPANS